MVKHFKDWLVAGLINDKDGNPQETPDQSTLRAYGLHWEQSVSADNHNEVAIVALYKYGQGYFIHEILHEKNIDIQQIQDVFRSRTKKHIVIMANPECANTLVGQGGFRRVTDGEEQPVRSAETSQEAITRAIKYINLYSIWLSCNSKTLLEHQQGYFWTEDASGNFIPESKTPSTLMKAVFYAFEHEYRDMQHGETPEEQHRSLQEANRRTQAGWSGHSSFNPFG